MSLKLNAGGMDIELTIRGYKKTSPGDSLWCRSDFSFFFKDAINYSVKDDEVFMAEEIDFLADAISNLLDGKLSAVRYLPMMEPDFEFTLYPGHNLNEEPGTWAEPGSEIEDIKAEWKVRLWSEGLSENHICATLRRPEIRAFYNYLQQIRMSAE